MQDLAHQLTYVIPIAIVIAFGFAFWLARDVLGRETGTKEMVAVGDVIYEGAVAFMRRQYLTIAALAVVTAIVLAVVIGVLDNVPGGRGRHTDAERHPDGRRVPDRGGAVGAVGRDRDVGGGALQRARSRGRAPGGRLGAAGRLARRGGVWIPGRRPVAARRLGPVRDLRPLLRGQPGGMDGDGPVPYRRPGLRRQLRGVVRPARRRHLHQGRRCRRRPGGQGRAGHPRGRPPQPGRGGRPGRRQRW